MRGKSEHRPDPERGLQREVVGRPGDLDDASPLWCDIPEEDPIERVRVVDRGASRRFIRTERIDESLIDQAANDRRLVGSSPCVEVASEHDGKVRALRLAAFEPIVSSTAARALATPLDQVGGAAFRADLASMLHETQYTRLFRS